MIWDDNWEDPKGAILLDENIFFKLHQPLLLQMVNTDFGRDLLCIPKHYPQILEIGPNHLRYFNGRNFTTDFRIGPKWANVIRHRFTAFNSYARYFLNDDRGVQLSPLVRQSRSLVAAITGFLPLPGNPATPCDGTCRNQATGGWAAVHDALTGTAEFTTNALVFTTAEFVSGTTFNIDRAFLNFNTAALPTTDFIASAQIQLHITAIENGINDSRSYTTIVGPTTPAATNAVVTGDFDQCGAITNPAKCSSDVMHSSLTAATYCTWEFNSAGCNAIVKGGTTPLGWRVGHDIENVSPGTGTVNEIDAKGADTAGTTTDPVLVVDSGPLVQYELPVMNIT